MGTRTTMKAVNAALQERGIPGELVKGVGYFYMMDRDEEPAIWATLPETSIMVYRLSNMSVDEWVESVELLLAEQRTQRGL